MIKKNVIILCSIISSLIFVSGCTSQCKAEWLCKDGSTLHYQKSDCSFTSEQICQYGCDENKCINKPPAPTPGVQRFEETDKSFTYSQNWKSESNVGASGGTWKAAGVKSETLDFMFNGIGVALISVKGPHGGIANVEIDGNYYKDINLYSDKIFQIREIIAEDLQRGNHRLRITVTGNKNDKAENSVIIVDAIDVIS